MAGVHCNVPAACHLRGRPSIRGPLSMRHRRHDHGMDALDMALRDALRERALKLGDATEDLIPLAERAAHARFVLIGEASHGTADFYRTRARLTRLLVERHGFTGVVAEADWPDALRATRYVRGGSEDRSAEQALTGFRRFPTWMWRNTEVVAFLEWLRQFNARTDGPGAGFYGMDLYSMRASMDAVIRYLEQTDPEAAERARRRYACFDGLDDQEYGRNAAYSQDSCEDAVVAQLVEFQRKLAAQLGESGADRDEHFYAEQNARLVKNAEEYYRAMYRGRTSSWNLRDTHMADTLDALAAHLEGAGVPAKLVVWAHNSHLGDASVTGMKDWGELNVGQLMRERHRGETFLLGQTTYTGQVTAAHDWGDFAERMKVRPGLPGSIEAVLHAAGLPRFALDLEEPGEVLATLREPRLQRFIGVIYRPSTERQSHYFNARLADQYDAVIHHDVTRALTPLDHEPRWRDAEAPETYPSGL